MTEKSDGIIGEFDRREILTGAGLLGGAAGLLGLGWYSTRSRDEPPPPEPEPEPEDDDEPPEEIEKRDVGPKPEEFETVINAVDAGADPDGTEPINFLFDEYPDDSTLFTFDPGTYRMEPFRIADRTQFGMIKSESEQPRFVPTDGECRGGHPYILFDDVSDLLLEDIQFDFRDTDSGGPMHLFLHGDSAIRNITYQGTCSNQLGVARIEVIDPEGAALVDAFETANLQNDNSLTAVYVANRHAGELTFRDCQMDNFSDNGLYASGPGEPDGGDGAVHAIGGTYRNNNIANVRLGSTGSTAEDVTVIVDSETPGYGNLNARGIRLRSRSEQRITNCDITYEEGAANAFGAIVFHPENGGGTVTDTRIRLERKEVPAIKAFAPDGAVDGAPVFEGVSITGSAAGGVTAEIEGRDNTIFRDCTIEQPGAGRQGLVFRNAQECRIIDSTITVDEAPVIADNASVTLENTTVATAHDEAFFDEYLVENESLTL